MDAISRKSKPMSDQELDIFLKKAEFVNEAVKKIADSKDPLDSSMANEIDKKYKSFEKLSNDLEIKEQLDQISLKDTVNPDARQFMDQVESNAQSSRMSSLQKIRNLKEDGNSFLKSEKFQDAKDSYEEALDLINFEDPEVTTEKLIGVLILSNLCLVLLKLNRPSKEVLETGNRALNTIRSFSKVFEGSQNNEIYYPDDHIETVVKVLIRIGNGLEKEKQLNEASEKYKEAEIVLKNRLKRIQPNSLFEDKNKQKNLQNETTNKKKVEEIKKQMEFIANLIKNCVPETKEAEESKKKQILTISSLKNFNSLELEFKNGGKVIFSKDFSKINDFVQKLEYSLQFLHENPENLKKNQEIDTIFAEISKTADIWLPKLSNLLLSSNPTSKTEDYEEEDIEQAKKILSSMFGVQKPEQEENSSKKHTEISQLRELKEKTINCLLKISTQDQFQAILLQNVRKFWISLTNGIRFLTVAKKNEQKLEENEETCFYKWNFEESGKINTEDGFSVHVINGILSILINLCIKSSSASFLLKDIAERGRSWKEFKYKNEIQQNSEEIAEFVFRKSFSPLFSVIHSLKSKDKLKSDEIDSEDKNAITLKILQLFSKIIRTKITSNEEIFEKNIKSCLLKELALENNGRILTNFILKPLLFKKFVDNSINSMEFDSDSMENNNILLLFMISLLTEVEIYFKDEETKTFCENLAKDLTNFAEKPPNFDIFSIILQNFLTWKQQIEKKLKDLKQDQENEEIKLNKDLKNILSSLGNFCFIIGILASKSDNFFLKRIEKLKIDNLLEKSLFEVSKFPSVEKSVATAISRIASRNETILSRLRDSGTMRYILEKSKSLLS